jgi:hypothetical protein
MDSCEQMIIPKILTIKPSYNHSIGTKIAIFDEETDQIMACGLLFAPNQIKLAEQARQFWELQVGAETEPKTLYIEYPQASSYRTLMVLSMFCAQIENEFFPTTTLRTRSKTWNTRVP